MNFTAGLRALYRSGFPGDSVNGFMHTNQLSFFSIFLKYPVVTAEVPTHPPRITSSWDTKTLRGVFVRLCDKILQLWEVLTAAIT